MMKKEAPMPEERKTAGVIAPPPLLLLVSLIVGFVLSNYAPLGVLERLPQVLRYAVGGGISAGAVAMSIAAVAKFGAEKTPVNPYFPPRRLVTGGIFAFLRNPMYVAFYGLSFGLAIIFAADWLIATTVLLAMIIHYGVVRREERFLEATFGDAYRDYRSRTPRYGWKR
jgi:protein-S-isoprenylcysteine O-methyltransferase Ste14